MTTRPRLHHWFRLGYAMRGLVYMLLGYLAWATGRGQSARSAVEQLHDLPGGAALLLAAAIGLAGIGPFRIGDALFDFDGRGGRRQGGHDRLIPAWQQG